MAAISPASSNGGKGRGRGRGRVRGKMRRYLLQWYAGIAWPGNDARVSDLSII